MTRKIKTGVVELAIKAVPVQVENASFWMTRLAYRATSRDVDPW